MRTCLVRACPGCPSDNFQQCRANHETRQKICKWDFGREGQYADASCLLFGIQWPLHLMGHSASLPLNACTGFGGSYRPAACFTEAWRRGRHSAAYPQRNTGAAGAVNDEAVPCRMRFTLIAMRVCVLLLGMMIIFIFHISRRAQHIASLLVLDSACALMLFAFAISRGHAAGRHRLRCPGHGKV
jgi:hypothetical protein